MTEETKEDLIENAEDGDEVVEIVRSCDAVAENLDRLLHVDYDNLDVSTKTFVVRTNMLLKLRELYDYLPISEYVPAAKKRGRKKKDDNHLLDPSNGSIICMKYTKEIRGTELKKPTQSAKRRERVKKEVKCFRNSFTVIMLMEKKPVNMKISSNGMLQLTGVKTDSQVEGCVKHLWKLISLRPDLCAFSRGDEFEALLVPCMRNIDFDLGFNVDREKLAEYMMSNSDNKNSYSSSYVSPKNFIEDIMDSFKGSIAQRKEVNELYEKIRNKSSKINRAKPQSVASAIVFWWTKYKKMDISIKDFAYKCKLSELTINRIAKEINSVLGTTVPLT